MINGVLEREDTRTNKKSQGARHEKQRNTTSENQNIKSRKRSSGQALSGNHVNCLMYQTCNRFVIFPSRPLLSNCTLATKNTLKLHFSYILPRSCGLGSYSCYCRATSSKLYLLHTPTTGTVTLILTDMRGRQVGPLPAQACSAACCYKPPALRKRPVPAKPAGSSPRQNPPLPAKSQNSARR